ncbi:MAG: hypothetical protein IJ308_08120 [Clostridia bacterium]|nr:hypothetical protein [Clostridia bacterium]MBQ7913683.1 hypothetical protein [Clostridia bacterium]
MGIIIAIVVIVAAVGCFMIYRFIMNRNKNCPACKQKYDSSCIVDAKVVRTVKAAMGKDYSDVNVTLHCKKCGKEHKTQVTLQGNIGDRYLDEELKKHFDK